jgi:predicted HAD superfamily Cof-like phosphohydrolase
MENAGQEIPDKPCIPSPEVRLLRAKLIFEEAMETIEALGVDIMLSPFIGQHDKVALSHVMGELVVNPHRKPDLVLIADGCADISVVTTGTLSACGIQDEELLEEVDKANLAKFGPGGYKREDGKWIKPKDWVPPDILGVLKAQGYVPSIPVRFVFGPIASRDWNCPLDAD